MASHPFIEKVAHDTCGQTRDQKNSYYLKRWEERISLYDLINRIISNFNASSP